MSRMMPCGGRGCCAPASHVSDQLQARSSGDGRVLLHGAQRKPADEVALENG